MKALRYFFCIACPPVAVFLTGRMMSFILSIFLTIFGLWVGGVIHAILVVSDYEADRRAARIFNR
jgi:uncharacterized membrane protein YqaE (UPF0057 family)